MFTLGGWITKHATETNIWKFSATAIILWQQLTKQLSATKHCICVPLNVCSDVTAITYSMFTPKNVFIIAVACLSEFQEDH